MSTVKPAKPSVAVAIPAYNEADGILEFVREIDSTLTAVTDRLTLVVVDDASSDGTPDRLEAVRGELAGELRLVRSPVNRGHGPTLLDAYRLALDAQPDFVLAVDGDGQFRGTDLRRIVVLLTDQAHAVCGVRRFRQDPRFRMMMTRLLRLYVRAGFGVGAQDANCPLRGYDAALLARLLGELPPSCLIPNLYLTIVASRQGWAMLEVDVSHSVRRGSSAQGSTWSGRRGLPVPWRLVRFSAASLAESLAFRSGVLAQAPLPRRDPF